METLQSCPCCLEDVEIISVARKTRVEHKYYFFVHCRHCGKATSNSYPSKNILAAMWNTMVLENKNAYAK